MSEGITIWIHASLPPATLGWFKIKSGGIESVAPRARNAAGEHVWVIPEGSVVDYWAELSNLHFTQIDTH